MIAAQLNVIYNHHYLKIKRYSSHIYVADYSDQTQFQRSVEFFSPNPPNDITFFSILNPSNLSIAGIDFDNNSFVCGNGNPRTQCESVFFPNVSDLSSWVLFCELKYSARPLNNTNNLRKAMKQLYKTRYYYLQNAVISSSNPTYLIASLPLQSEPFANFTISQPMLTRLRRDRNIILRFKNTVSVQTKILL